jgi:hypothetical protein
MDNKKFEQLIDLIINEDEDKARALFHDIVVEKSREIYESLMDEEMVDSPVEGLMDEISAEEAGGMTEEEEDLGDIDSGEEEIELDADELDGEEMGEEDLEDRVVDLEDKLDQLMAEFEELMGNEGGEEGGEEDFGGEEGDEMMESADDEEDDEEEVTEAEEDDEEEETLEEAVQLQKVSVTHGDNGVNTKSPTLGANKKISDNGAKPVASGFQDSGKGGTQGGLLNPATKDLKGAGTFKNAPGKGNFSEKGEAAPKPKAGDDGADKRSPVAESKKSVKKIIKK